MSQSPVAGESGGDRFEPQNNRRAIVNDDDTSMGDNVPSDTSTITSVEARAGAAQPTGNAGGSGVRLIMEDESFSNKRHRQSPSLSPDASSSVLEGLPSKPFPAMKSPPSAAGGPPTRPQNPRAGTRNRGFSLRRSLFRRNIQSQPEPDGTVVEMVPPEPCSAPSISSATTGKRDKGQPCVTVSTFAVDEDTSIKLDPIRIEASLGDRRVVHRRSPLLQPRRRLLSRLGRSYQWVQKTLLRVNDVTPTADGRHISLDFSDPSIPIDERTGVPYISNVIRSSRYTLVNFFPRQLIAQFSKLANFYFLIVSILQMIPGLSTTGTYTTIVPLLIFVSISMAKEGYDDIRRWRLDKEENNRDALVLDREWHPHSQDKTQWKPTKWHGVKVGDVLLLKRNYPIPADLVLLHTDGSNGAAYIEVFQLALNISRNVTDYVARPWRLTAKQISR